MRKKIYIAILNQGSVRTEMAQLILDLAKQDKYETLVSYPADKPITQNRNKIVKKFLETDYDFLLMLDGDCIPPQNILELADYNKDIAGGLCFGFLKKMIIPFCMKDRGDGKYDMADVYEDGGMVECDAIGTGCIMIARKVLEDMPFPFRNEYDPEGIKIQGLDFNFCRRAKKKGHNVFCNTSMPVSHWTIIDLKTMWANFNQLKQVATNTLNKENK